MSPTMRPVKELTAGEVGYVVTGLKDVSRLRVGDTLTSRARPAAEPLPGYKDVKPMVFAGLFPTDSDQYPELRDALERLKLNDALALLRAGDLAGARVRLPLRLPRPAAHGDRPRAARARVRPRPARHRAERRLPRRRRRRASRSRCTTRPRCRASSRRSRSRTCKASIIVPKDYVGAVMELCNDRRGALRPHGVPVRGAGDALYDLPLGEIVLDYYDQLKSRTRGYASFDYDFAGFRPGKLERVDILIAGEPVDALSLIIHRDGAYDRGRALVERLRAGDPAPVLRRPDPGRDRLARDRPRDGEGEAQGRAREVLRRRHLAQAQAAREAEEGQEADEAGRRGRGAAGGVPRRAQPRTRRRSNGAGDARRVRAVRSRLAAGGPAAICSFECTFCVECAEAMEHVCPNCAGELVPRPRRAA